MLPMQKRCLRWGDGLCGGSPPQRRPGGPRRPGRPRGRSLPGVQAAWSGVSPVPGQPGCLVRSLPGARAAWSAVPPVPGRPGCLVRSLRPETVRKIVVAPTARSSQTMTGFLFHVISQTQKSVGNTLKRTYYTTRCECE